MILWLLVKETQKQQKIFQQVTWKSHPKTICDMAWLDHTIFMKKEYFQGLSWYKKNQLLEAEIKQILCVCVCDNYSYHLWIKKM